MIEVEGLTRYYGSTPAVLDVSLEIQDREIVGFLGLNGAGKSTILMILAGLLLPSAGLVRIGGVDAIEASDSLRRRIGFLPEEPPLYREMRVREFLQWCGEVKGRPRARVKQDLPDVMEVCKISEVGDRVIGQLSHGFRKRVGIAQAVVHRPDLVILDEPISGLDPKQIVEMRKVVRSLKERATVLISSHILSEISQTCDRILVLDGGRLVAEGTEQELAGRMEDGNRLSLTLRPGRYDVGSILDALSAVSTHEVRETPDGCVDVTVTLNGDVRESLVTTLVEAGIGIRRVDDAEPELERIFLGLTRGEASAAEPEEEQA
jgi:ABC-2 type transport system ATP-binding protein